MERESTHMTHAAEEVDQGPSLIQRRGQVMNEMSVDRRDVTNLAAVGKLDQDLDRDQVSVDAIDIDPSQELDQDPDQGPDQVSVIDVDGKQEIDLELSRERTQIASHDVIVGAMQRIN
eukprot:GILJ01000450.1.p2 GENE.GILJ01000450.1~~GILJ01000450.1.p2  ORF type:complete len:118 (-),score=16.87 GILJ01000450.1:90-443(-)